ncbi:hypothetical protein Cgig2_031026 [Carnegiea gigantea]|uniref:Uncharacterized protein n=1 Tax=Carnegiea gigantea TaxID=171969 RepID=A0A9Q1QG71_9CARY|nr:hypothetical protein Cgig2_031026 [Carnegiea gigantea]
MQRWVRAQGNPPLLTLLGFEVEEHPHENQKDKTATNALSKKFNVKCLPEHRDNHLKTVKNARVVISKLRDKDSGFECDDNLKMITASPTVYNTYTEANSTHEKYLNKKTDTYDEMAVVVGKGVARGSGAKSFDDVEIHSYRNTANLEEKDDGDSEFMKDNDKQPTSSVTLESRKSRKRTRGDDLELQNISAQVEEVALALQKISKSKLDVDLLYQEVMRTEGFEDEFLGSAFDYLIERENLAKGFLGKSEKLRSIWLEKFKENN